MSKHKLISGKTLSGIKVVNATYDDLGEVKDLMIDPVSGNIVYAVLTFGGFMGFGEKYFAIPWEAFYLDTARKEEIILNIPKQKLEQAPGFDKDNWPSMAQWEYVDKVYRYFGYKPYTAKRPVNTTSEIPANITLRNNHGLGNAAKRTSFKQGRVETSRVKEAGIT